MVLYRPYALQALQWQSLSSVSTSSTTATESSSPTLKAAHENLQKALQEKRWLLQPNQHLVVPPTHLDEKEHGGGNGRIFSMGDFVRRADKARELDVQACSLDDSGRRRRPLTDKQLHQLKQTGELTVPSVLFENQYHTWKIAPGFYSGRETVQRSFQEGFGKTLDHVVVYTRDAVVQQSDENIISRPTLRKAATNGLGQAGKLLRGAARQLFAGRLKHRTYSEQAIDSILEEAEFGYVRHHLQRDGHDTRRLCEWTQHIRTEEQLDKFWNILQDDANFSVEYRRNSQQLFEDQDAHQKLKLAKENFERTMGPKRNTQLKMDPAKCDESPKAAMEELRRAEREWNKTKEQAWIEQLKNSTRQDIKDVAALEVDRLMALKIEQEIMIEDKMKIQEDLKDYQESIKKKRPILSLSRAWRERKLEKHRVKTTAAFESTRLDRVALRMESEDLQVQGSARKLAAKFRQEVREDLAKSLRSKQSSFPEAKFEVLQLNPNNWGGDTQHGFKRYKTVKVDLGKPFWRVHYSWMMAVTISKSLIGGAYHFLASGPFSLRALLSSHAYYAVERPVRDPSSLTQTLTSRLRSFHETLRSVRTRFESSPDTGLIGKSIQRFFLRSYLALKGTMGTVWIVAFMTLGTAISTILSAVVLVTAPFLGTFFTLGTMLFNLAVYDTAISRARNRFNSKSDGLSFDGEPEMPSTVSPLLKIGIGAPYCLIVPGAIQAVFALIRLGVVHPLAGAVHLAWASLRFVMRSLRDSFTWFFIRKHSRIPASDTFLAWRIHGPGLAPTQYYRLPVEAAKASVMLLLDKYRLHAHAQVRRVELEAPYKSYKALFNTVVHPFGMDIVMNVPSPSVIGYQISSSAEKRSSTRQQLQNTVRIQRPKTKEHAIDIWEEVAQGIRSSHPDYRLAQQSYAQHRWDSAPGPVESLSKVDETIRFNVDAEYEEHKSKGKTELDEMVNRAAKILAEWTLQMDFRENRLAHAVAIPPSAAGCFRMSQAEQQDLWRFTLNAVETYGHQLKEELEGIVFVSEFPNQVESTVNRIVDSFYTRSGARPGKDIPVVASFLLSRLLGGDHMLETLEETDETLLLSPKMSEEDEHLVFWRSFALE